MDRIVREPIQTYLTEAERAELDRTATDLGVSRSEALRRGIRALAHGHRAAAEAATFSDLVTPAKTRSSAPPPSHPVLPLEEILAGLAEDRENR